MQTNTSSNWEPLWRSLRVLEEAWPDDRNVWLYGILHDTDPRELIDMSSGHAPTQHLVGEAEAARDWTRGVVDCSPTSTFDDVYHAALFWRLWNEPQRLQIPSDRGATWLYRGENKCFPKTTTSLHRLTDEAELDQSVRRLERFVDVASVLWPWLDERQLIALAQHYGGEPKVRLQTWLLDITWDPYVALFFASYGWKSPAEGEEEWAGKGRVTAIEVREWHSVFKDSGDFETIRVPGFSRIRNQRALFLDAPDPSIIGDYSPFRTYFHQKPGLVFTDPGMSVSEEFLLSKNKRRNIDGWEKEAGPDVVVPPLRDKPRRKPESLRFETIAAAIVHDTEAYKDLESNPKRDKIISLLGRLHGKMRTDDSIDHVALNSLHDAVRKAPSGLERGEDLEMRQVMASYRDRCFGTDCICVNYWIDRADRRWRARDTYNWRDLVDGL